MKQRNTTPRRRVARPALLRARGTAVARHLIAPALGLLLMLLPSACHVNDPIYDPSAHLSLTTDWTERTVGIEVPETYTVSVQDGPSISVSGTSFMLPQLFEPGTYQLRVFNTPQHITLSDDAPFTATLATAPAPEGWEESDGNGIGSRSSTRSSISSGNIGSESISNGSISTGNIGTGNISTGNISSRSIGTRSDGSDLPFVQPQPGWLFTSTLSATLTAPATDQSFTARMRQQVRQLTLLIEPSGGTAARIARIEAYLEGVASMLNVDTDVHSAPACVALSFSRQTDGNTTDDPVNSSPASKWAATVRLLGTAGPQQRLYARIYFENDQPDAITLQDAAGNPGSDLTAVLSDFNADKKAPLTLRGAIVETPTGTGFSATIRGWNRVTGGPVVAN